MSEIVINNSQVDVNQGDTKSYFDGGLFQYIGWSLLGVLVTVFNFRYLLSLVNHNDSFMEN